VLVVLESMQGSCLGRERRVNGKGNFQKMGGFLTTKLRMGAENTGEKTNTEGSLSQSGRLVVGPKDALNIWEKDNKMVGPNTNRADT